MFVVIDPGLAGPSELSELTSCCLVGLGVTSAWGRLRGVKYVSGPARVGVWGPALGRSRSMTTTI